MPRLIEFPEQTVVFAKDQPEYRPLPAHLLPNDPTGTVTFCWQFSPEEILQLVANEGKLWHAVMTFGGALQPQNLLLDQPPFGNPGN